MGHIERNPIQNIEKPRAGQRDQCITRDEFQSICSNFRDEEFLSLIQTAWQCGARPQELIRVEARHVDLENARWVFPKNEAKRRKRVRIVYLTDDALEATRRLVLKHPEGPLFRNTRRKGWTPFAVSCWFGRLAKKLGTRYCLYSFRHSFATRLLESEIDALTVSVLMGHTDTTMLGRVYQHLSHNPALLREQINRAIS